MDYELKRWKEKYIKALSGFASDGDVSELLPGGLPADRAEAEKYIEQRLLADDEREYCRAVLVEEEPSGFIEIITGSGWKRKNARVRFFIVERYRERGVMSKALAQTAKKALEQMDVVRLEACVREDNLAARRTLNNAGFTLEATLAKRIFNGTECCNMCVYSIVK